MAYRERMKELGSLRLKKKRGGGGDKSWFGQEVPTYLIPTSGHSGPNLCDCKTKLKTVISCGHKSSPKELRHHHKCFQN